MPCSGFLHLRVHHLGSDRNPSVALCGAVRIPALGKRHRHGLLSAVNLGRMILSGWLTDRMNFNPLLLGIIWRMFAVA